MKKLLILILSLMLVTTLIACGGNEDAAETTNAPVDTSEPEELDAQLMLSDLKTITVDTSVRHQEIESFGASGAWWSQIVGVNESTRERVAKLLFDPEEGIGLNCYRYNIGGGSRDTGANSPSIGDVWRRTYSFKDKNGDYDWSRDEGAVWFMKKASEYGVDEIVMFVNSPIESLTRNGRTYADTTQSNKSNLPPENYEAFANYVLDVAEHFKAEGLPIKFISPINEPQYTWDYATDNVWGQEGCHYSNSEIVDILKVFVEKIGERDGLDGVEICAPDGGSWNNDTLQFNLAIMRDKTLGQYFTAIDNHSYWTETATKRMFKQQMNKVAPNVKYRESEWCEMTTGRDLSMDSALTLAETVYEDMTILDCVSWQYWIAVSCYDYRDGLIYTDTNGGSVQVPKRLWAMGNYSRYIDRGYTRVDCTPAEKRLSVSAYEGTNENGEKEIVLVVVNKYDKAINIDFAGVDSSVYNRISVHVTDKSHSLSRTYYAEFLDTTAITISAQSVTTIVISSK